MIRQIRRAVLLITLAFGVMTSAGASHAADITTEMSRLYALPLIDGRIILDGRTLILGTEGRGPEPAIVTLNGRQVALPPRENMGRWDFFRALRAYRLRVPEFEDSVRLGSLLFDTATRQSALGQLGLGQAVPENAWQTEEGFRSFLLYSSDEFAKQAFHNLMRRTYDTDYLVGEVKIVWLSVLKVGTYDHRTQALPISGATEIRLVSGESGDRAAMQISMPHHDPVENIAMDEATAQALIRAMPPRRDSFGERLLYLSTMGSITLSPDPQTGMEFVPETMQAYLDPALSQPVGGLDQSRLVVDKRIAEAESARSAADSEAARAANEKRAEDARLKNLAASKARRTDNPLNILKLRLGQSVAEAEAAIASANTTYARLETTPQGGRSPGLSPCQVAQSRLKSAMRTARAKIVGPARDAQATDDQLAMLAQHQAEIVAQMKPECRPNSSPVAESQYYRAQFDGGITDTVALHFGDPILANGRLVAVIRSLDLQGASVDIAGQMKQGLGTDTYEISTRTFWFSDPEILDSVRSDQDIANKCARYSPWTFSPGEFSPNRFAARCGAVLGLGIIDGDASMYLVDTDHFADARDALNASAVQERAQQGNQIEF